MRGQIAERIARRRGSRSTLEVGAAAQMFPKIYFGANPVMLYQLALDRTMLDWADYVDLGTHQIREHVAARGNLRLEYEMSAEYRVADLALGAAGRLGPGHKEMLARNVGDGAFLTEVAAFMAASMRDDRHMMQNRFWLDLPQVLQVTRRGYDLVRVLSVEARVGNVQGTKAHGSLVSWLEFKRP